MSQARYVQFQYFSSIYINKNINSKTTLPYLKCWPQDRHSSLCLLKRTTNAFGAGWWEYAFFSWAISYHRHQQQVNRQKQQQQRQHPYGPLQSISSPYISSHLVKHNSSRPHSCRCEVNDLLTHFCFNEFSLIMVIIINIINIIFIKKKNDFFIKTL